MPIDYNLDSNQNTVKRGLPSIDNITLHSLKEAGSTALQPFQYSLEKSFDDSVGNQTHRKGNYQKKFDLKTNSITSIKGFDKKQSSVVQSDMNHHIIDNDYEDRSPMA